MPLSHELLTELVVPLEGSMVRLVEVSWVGEMQAAGRKYLLKGDGMPPPAGLSGVAGVAVTAGDDGEAHLTLRSWRAHG